MANLLTIVYQPEYWVHALLVEIAAQPKLTSAHRQWASPATQLSDLAFSIETRLGNLRELVRFVDENLNALGKNSARTEERSTA